MPNFGFNITKGRQIDYDNNDLSLYHFITEREPSFQLCIGCGGCTATCSAGNFTTFHFRKMHHLIKRGETDQLEEKIAGCMFCGKCKLVCPRGVNTRNVIILIKRAFVENPVHE